MGFTSTLIVSISARAAVSGAKAVVRGVKRMAQAARNASASMTGLGSSTKKLFALIGGGLIFKKMATTMAGFEDAMGQLQGVTRATGEEMKLFAETARELGATTRFTAGEAANALVSLSRAGFDVQESTAAVASTLDLATGQMLELGEATKFVASSIRQFGLAAEDAERVADVLTNTANSAATDVRELASAMSFGGVAARAVGVSLEETAAIMGVLSDSAIRGTRAGMGVRSMMTKLVAPTKAGADAIKKLGLELEDVNPQAVGITTALENLKNANIDVAEAVDIFGQRQFVAALAAVENIEKIKELTAANMAAAGSSRIAASIMEDTLSGAFKELKSAMEEATLSAGDKGFLGGLKGIIRFATDVIRALSGVQTGASEVFKDLNLAVIRAIKFWGTLFAKVKGGFKFITGLIRIGASTLKNLYIGAINTVIGAVGDMAVAFTDALASMLEQGASVASFFSQDMVNAISGMRIAALNAKSDLQDMFVDIEIPKEEVEEFFGLTKRVLGETATEIGKVNAAYAIQRSAIVQTWNEQQKVRQEVEKTKLAIEQKTEATKRSTEAVAALKNMWKLVSSGVTDTGSKVLNSIANMGRAAGGAIKNVAQQIGGAKKLADEFKITMQDVGSAVTGSLVDAAVGAKSLNKAFMDITQSLIRMALQKAIMAAFTPAAVAIPGGAAPPVAAKGLVAMANGGVVSRPTAAIIGEKGPEAVVPLHKGPDGVLGIAGGGTTNNTNLTFVGDARGMMDQMMDPRTIQKMNQIYKQGYSL